MTTQYEIVEHVIELGDRVPLTPMPLPVGWVPLSVLRRESRVIVLMTREISVTPGVAWPYHLVVGKSPPPTANGGVSFGSDDQAAPLSVWLRAKDDAGVDHSAAFAALGEGAVVQIARRDSPDVWQEYLCKVTPPVVNGLVVVDDPVHWGSTGELLVPSNVNVTVRPE